MLTSVLKGPRSDLFWGLQLNAASRAKTKRLWGICLLSDHLLDLGVMFNLVSSTNTEGAENV